METETRKTANTGTNENGRRKDLPFRVLDAVIIAAVLIASIIPLLSLKKVQADIVVITWHGEEIYREKLSIDAVIVTPDGRNTVEISNGSVRMLEADCRDGICTKAGNAAPARPVICLPNRVIVRVVSESEADSISW